MNKYVPTPLRRGYLSLIFPQAVNEEAEVEEDQHPCTIGFHLCCIVYRDSSAPRSLGCRSIQRRVFGIARSALKSQS